MQRFLTSWVGSFQEFVLLAGRAFLNIVRRPHYYADVFLQMDAIGIGSIPITVLIGFFSGAIIALQMSRALNTYGASSQVGSIVALTLVRELGPVLTALLVAGRNASGIASELGSMKVTEQIDAMRALGTDPIQKLVTPRLTATALMLPCLTVVADVCAGVADDRGWWLEGLLVAGRCVGPWAAGESVLVHALSTNADSRVAATIHRRVGIGGWYLRVLSAVERRLLRRRHQLDPGASGRQQKRVTLGVEQVEAVVDGAALPRARDPDAPGSS